MAQWAEPDWQQVAMSFRDRGISSLLNFLAFMLKLCFSEF